MRPKNDSLPAVFISSLRNRKNRRGIDEVSVEETSPVVASYNVHKCIGRDGKFDPDRICRVIHELRADVVALQEADSRFGERTGLLDLGIGDSPVKVLIESEQKIHIVERQADRGVHSAPLNDPVAVAHAEWMGPHWRGEAEQDQDPAHQIKAGQDKTQK